MDIIEAISKPSGIPHINEGGCAKYAVALSERLTKIGIRNQIIYLYSFWFDGLLEYTIHKQTGIAACDHAVVRVNGEYYDGDGRIKKSDIRFQRTNGRPVRFDVCKKHLRQNRWNPTFEQTNKRKGEKVIEQYLDSIFKSHSNGQI